MRRRAALTGLAAFALGGCSRAPSVFARQQETVPVVGKAAQLLAAARAQTRHFVQYDSGYTRIGYPGGDVAPDKGVCSDVLIRAYRTALGIDLQKLVHEDMAAHFNLYPHSWGLKTPDSSIDHRRVPNLMVFFSRFGQVLPLSNNPDDYRPGDIIANKPFGTHIALVSDVKVGGRLQVIENIGGGVQVNDHLLGWPLLGHYRYGLDA